MRKIYIMLLMSSVVLLTACDMLDIQPTGKVIPQTLAEYRALIATAYKNVPDARGLACFRSDELYVKDDSWEQDRYGKIECWDDFSAPGQTTSFEWKNFYSIMFTANYTIEERNSINEGSEEDIDQLIGECYLLRAYMHFLLVNLYGQPYTRPGALETKAVPLKLNSDINGFVELGIGKSFDEFDSFIQSVELLGFNFALVLFFAFADLCHYFTPSTVIPMERALPAIVRTAASISAAVRSGILVLAISSA